MFKTILPTAQDEALKLPGDDMLPSNSLLIHSGFDVYAQPNDVFPWLVQLGKKRAGWYFPKRIEMMTPKAMHGLRYIEPKWQKLKVGQRIPDYGGKHGYFDCFYFEKDKVIGYTSTRGNITMTWVLALLPIQDHTRVVIRLRMHSTKGINPFFWRLGTLIDRITISWLAAGLRERVTQE